MLMLFTFFLIEDGKTSVCYEYSPGKGISIGSTQIGPYYADNSILLNYTG